jgi:hypothetical protein
MNKDEIKSKMLEKSGLEGSEAKMLQSLKAANNTRDVIKKRERFVLSLAETLGNVTEACKLAGISRRTYYNWYEESPEFRQAVQDVHETRLDMLEEAALKKALEKQDTTMLIFLLKTQAAQRGYQEHKRMSVEVTKKQSFKLGSTDLEF